MKESMKSSIVDFEVADLDLVEANEAFAAQALGVNKVCRCFV
jgi:Thiolase, C-terminal domain.